MQIQQSLSPKTIASKSAPNSGGTDPTQVDAFTPGEPTAPGLMPQPHQLGLASVQTPQRMVRVVADHILAQPCITEGLNQPYSPNHTHGLTTRQHIETQIEMVKNYVGPEQAAVKALQNGDYSALHKMVDNPTLPEKLRVTEQHLRDLLEPLRQGLTVSDWKVLTVVAGYHDLGKMDPKWGAQSGMDLKGVEWMAHDFDSETMLRNNPAMLKAYELNGQEESKVLTLCRLHSLPGQFFFGEGNLSAYSPLFRTAETDKSDNILKMARVHGVLDVMSAINDKMVKPILDSHTKLRDFITEAYENHTPLGQKYRQQSVQELQKACQGEHGAALMSIQNNHGQGPVALQRLQKLLGGDVKPADIEKAFANLPPKMAHEFHEATDGEKTWFGTYMANSYGSGLAKALKVGKEGALAEGHEVAEAMIKMVACASQFRRELDPEQRVRPEWALGSLGPSLVVVKDAESALEVLRETQKFSSTEAGVAAMTSGQSKITLRGGETGVEFGWKA